MLISVFTPTHNPERLPELYASLRIQTHKEWERVILLNNLGPEDIKKVLTTFNDDQRVMVYVDEYDGPNKGYVGRLKKSACEKCFGEWLVEVDHDDLLEPTALEEVAKVPLEYDMCYSNTVNINWPAITPVTRSAYYGWTNRPFKFMGKEVMEAVSAQPFPQSISRIWFAPNHLRAWRRDFYTEIGGHDITLKISDDHNLIQRTYLEGKIYHIDKPLYIYRIRGDNTRQQNAAEIQRTMRQVHDKYFFDMMKKRSRENDYINVDLGGAINCPDGLLSVDRHNANIEMDLNGEWNKLPTSSVGYMRAHHILEHLKDPIHALNEAYRTLAHGGILDIEVPSNSPLFINGVFYPAIGDKSDPTHVSSWNARSFRYATEPGMRKYIEPEAKYKFTIIKPAREFLKFDNVPILTITLMAEKGGHRFYGANNRRTE